jgi:hypothetical protein
MSPEDQSKILELVRAEIARPHSPTERYKARLSFWAAI